MNLSIVANCDSYKVVLSYALIWCNMNFCIAWRYQTEFGFTIPDRPILVDDIRVRGVGKALVREEKEVPATSSPPVATLVGTFICLFYNIVNNMYVEDFNRH